jgi:hypothetical protein
MARHGTTSLSSPNDRFVVRQLAKGHDLVYDEESSNRKPAHLYIQQSKNLCFCHGRPSAPEDEKFLVDLLNIIQVEADKGKSTHVILVIRPYQRVWVVFEEIDRCTMFLDALEISPFKIKLSRKDQ